MGCVCGVGTWVGTSKCTGIACIGLELENWLPVRGVVAAEDKSVRGDKNTSSCDEDGVPSPDIIILPPEALVEEWERTKRKEATEESFAFPFPLRGVSRPESSSPEVTER